ncbi:MAG: toprim domain-containing protein [Planctomycetaceae bacterium]|nr:toprim domain-containing protein [Planctomycetaceae bacterium]
METETQKKLWWLQEMGLEVLDNSSTEWTCVCPFCEDAHKHFYLNSNDILYDCKKCSAKGNYLTLMSKFASILAKDFDDKSLARLARDRKLPTEAFADYDFGWTGNFYTLPVRDAKRKINNILRYKIGGKLLSAPGCKMGLFGAQQLSNTHRKAEPVYIFEGPWDAIAFEWLRCKAKQQGIITAVMGAGNLPNEFLKFFQDCIIFIAQDNDQAGTNGENRIANKLIGIAKELKFFKWDKDEEQGKDIRDLIIEGLL